jgi:Zn-finger nucleic acid-binding protein
MNCPRCATSLTSHQTPNALLQGCLACGGIFLDNAARQRIIATVDAAAAQASDLAAAHARWTPDLRQRIACPACGRPMEVTHVVAGGFELDVCDAHGAWFDRDELRRFVDALARQRSKSDKKSAAKMQRVPPPPRDSSPPPSSKKSADDSGESTGLAVAAGAFGLFVDLLDVLSD